jgi:3-hydroxyisobutyrate dehydrogenase-like beta-hydroxyacid dehydrogenase
MGSRIAGRLLDAAHEVVVWNRTPGAAAPLLRRGAIAAASPADAARRAGTVIVTVSDPVALTSVSEGADGLVSGLHAGLQIIAVGCSRPEVVAAADEVLAPVEHDGFAGKISELAASRWRIA